MEIGKYKIRATVRAILLLHYFWQNHKAWEDVPVMVLGGQLKSIGESIVQY